MDPGIDLSDFYMSVEWDILEVGPLTKNVFSYFQKLYVENMSVFKIRLTASLSAKSSSKIAAFRFLPRETSSSTLAVTNHIWTLHSTSQCAGRHYSTQ